jgi:hypothetical protein
MLYEIRRWSDEIDCLYTDDPRVKDLAVTQPGLKVSALYFRALGESRPFAWDILGSSEAVKRIAGSFAAGIDRPGRS